MNHFLWPFLAAFHKATPFQGMVQSKISNKIRFSMILYYPSQLRNLGNLEQIGVASSFNCQNKNIAPFISPINNPYFSLANSENIFSPFQFFKIGVSTTF